MQETILKTSILYLWSSLAGLTCSKKNKIFWLEERWSRRISLARWLNCSIDQELTFSCTFSISLNAPNFQLWPELESLKHFSHFSPSWPPSLLTSETSKFATLTSHWKSLEFAPASSGQSWGSSYSQVEQSCSVLWPRETNIWHTMLCARVLWTSWALRLKRSVEEISQVLKGL